MRLVHQIVLISSTSIELSLCVCSGTHWQLQKKHVYHEQTSAATILMPADHAQRLRNELSAAYHSEVHFFLPHDALQVIQNPGVALPAQRAQYQAKPLCLSSCLNCLSACLAHAFVVIVFLSEDSPVWVISAYHKFSQMQC